MDDLLAALDRELDFAVELRHRLHREPELGNSEHKTAALVVEGLEGIPVERVAGTGVLAWVGPDTPAVALRAELDGLPLAERTGVPFAATGASMHACGHDVHMAALVAVCRAASTAEAVLPARLLGVFQPSEEISPSGAERLVRAHVLQRHETAAVIGVHVHPDVPWGQLAVGAGAINASCDTVQITVAGTGGHGAYPHLAHDPVLAMSHIVVALQQVVSRRTNPLHSNVVTIASLQAGSTENVIPDQAEARGTLRALRHEDRELLAELVREIATRTAAAHGCEATVEVTTGEPVLVNDPELAAKVRSRVYDVGLELSAPVRSCGSDDFGFYPDVAPSLMAFLGLSGHREFSEVPLHHPRFLPPDDAVGAVARALVACYAAASSD